MSPKKRKQKQKPKVSRITKGKKVRADRCALTEEEQQEQFYDSNKMNSCNAIEDKDIGYAFCCCKCNCTIGHAMKYHGIRVIYSSNDEHVPHRPCCHNVEIKNDGTCDPEWMSETEKAIEEAQILGKTYPKNQIFYNDTKTEAQFQAALRNSKRLQERYVNDSRLADPATQLLTDDRVNQNHKKYNELLNTITESNKHAAVVLDCFGGIGTAFVVLKRLGIQMKKAIHVEHDMIAQHVVRYNHDVSWWEDENDPAAKATTATTTTATTKKKRPVHIEENDEIEHIFEYPKFEMILNDIDSFMEKHGPVDIVMGGPPCSDFTAVNANRSGTDGSQGHYLLDFGTLIQKIEKHPKQANHPLFFFAENVELKGDDLKRVEDAFGVPPIAIDAAYVSPCRRVRHFFTNIPLPSIKFDSIASDSTPIQCLEQDDGDDSNGSREEDSMWHLPGDAVGEPHSNSLWTKARTFMASHSRIEDSRMEVVKKDKDGQYICRSFSTLERERMMGFPDHYVSEPVNRLYHELWTNALRFCHPAFGRRLWQSDLKQKYWDFSGEEFKFESWGMYEDSDEDPFFIKLMMAPPQTGRAKTHFTQESYAKHLIGNAYSVVVVEILLSRLQDVFAQRFYKGYDYKYRWHYEDVVTRITPEIENNYGTYDMEVEDNDNTVASHNENLNDLDNGDIDNDCRDNHSDGDDSLIGKIIFKWELGHMSMSCAKF